MTTTNLGYLIILIIPVLIFNYQFNMKLNRKVIYAVTRMTIQLMLIGLFLQYLFDLNKPFFNITYVLFMMTVASYSMLKTTNLPIKHFGLAIWLSVLLPHLLVLFFFNFFIVSLDNVFEARYLVPIGGMLLGNSLSGNILAINTFYKQLKTEEKKYYYTLALSANKNEALIPYFTYALKSSISPTLASMETIGLVALPGMMTGQILGGSIPITAIKYQIAIMVAIFVTRYFTAILAIKLTSQKAFDDYDRLRTDLIQT